MLIGMVHVQALPAAPGHAHRIDRLEALAVQDARALADAGFAALIIENMHDAPYVHGSHTPETTAILTRIALAVRAAVGDDVAMGVQVLSGGNREALAIALAACGTAPRPTKAARPAVDLSGGFIRCENFVFSHVADEGLLTQAEAGPLLRYRRQIGADGAAPERRKVRVLCDIKKKHASHAITSDISIREAVEAAEFFGADGVIITGTATGKPASLGDVRAAAEATSLPVLVGSGVTPQTAPSLLEYADALIVGSWIKRAGRWQNPVDPQRARKLVKACR